MSNDYRDHLYIISNTVNEGVFLPALGIVTAGSLIGTGIGLHHKRKMAELEIEREKITGQRSKRTDDALNNADIPNRYLGLPNGKKAKNHLYKPKKK
jgi:hypothetical protein